MKAAIRSHHGNFASVDHDARAHLSLPRQFENMAVLHKRVQIQADDL